MTQQNEGHPPTGGSGSDQGDSMERIENLTPWRILLGDRVIPPFGSGEVDASTDTEDWVEHGYLRRLEPRADDPTTKLDSSMLVVGCGVWLAGLVILPAVVYGLVAGSRSVPVIACVTSLVVLAAMAWALVSRFRHGATQLASAVGIVAILFVVPALGVFLFNESVATLWQLIEQNRSAGLRAVAPLLLEYRLDIGLGLVQLLFVATGAGTPALLYYLWQYGGRTAAHNRFLRDVTLLDPTVRTTVEADRIHGHRFDELHGAAMGGTAGNRPPWPVLFGTLGCAVGWVLTILPAKPLPTYLVTIRDVYAYLLPHDHTLVYAFLGSYFFALGLLFRRYAVGDLRPKAYMHLIVRMVASLIVAFVLMNVKLDPISNALAFTAGILPVATLGMLVKSSARVRLVDFDSGQALTTLEGVTMYDRARLAEEGIDNVEGLAHHDLIDLVLRTRIPVPRLVDLLDQAILQLHVAQIQVEDAGGTQRKGRQVLLGCGIRTATDLRRVEASAKDESAREAFLGLLGRVSAGPESGRGLSRIQMVLDALADDEWLVHIEYWRQRNQRNHAPLDLNTLKKEISDAIERATGAAHEDASSEGLAEHPLVAVDVGPRTDVTAAEATQGVDTN